MLLNLRELEVFRAVMEAGGVTAAASALGITQPAASKMLRQAEERLGFALFRRDRRQLVPTPEAHALLPELLGVLATIDGLERLADALRAGQSGQLSIAAVPVLATALLPLVQRGSGFGSLSTCPTRIVSLTMLFTSMIFGTVVPYIFAIR